MGTGCPVSVCTTAAVYTDLIFCTAKKISHGNTIFLQTSTTFLCSSVTELHIVLNVKDYVNTSLPLFRPDVSAYTCIPSPHIHSHSVSRGLPPGRVEQSQNNCCMYSIPLSDCKKGRAGYLLHQDRNLLRELGEKSKV